jgi:hypothetical protein
MHDTDTPDIDTPNIDPGRTDTDATEASAGLQRSGTGHGSSPHQSEPARPDAPEPSSERPAEQEGPVGPDGAQRPPTDRTADPATWELDAQGDVSRPVDDRDADDHDPRVSTVPLDTDDGGTVVIEQQNVGPGQQVGAGEFKEPGTSSRHKRPETAAAEQDALERDAPVDHDGTGNRP